MAVAAIETVRCVPRASAVTVHVRVTDASRATATGGDGDRGRGRRPRPVDATAWRRTSWSRMRTPWPCTATCYRASPGGEASRAQPRRLRAFCSVCVAVRRAWPITTSSSRPTTTPSSMPSSAGLPARPRIRPSSLPWPTTPPCGRRVARRGSSSSTPRRTAVTTLRGLASAGRRRGLRRPRARHARRARCSTSVTACCSGRYARRPISLTPPAHRAGRSTAQPRHGLTGLFRPANAARCGGCTSSGDRPIPAADCRWRPSPPRSSPPRSAKICQQQRRIMGRGRHGWRS